MQLQVLGSSSSGNCYLLHNEKECLIIEAGINVLDVKKALDFEIGTIVGCIVSHKHGDHAGKVMQFAQNGINVYAHESVIEGKKHFNLSEIKAGKTYMFGGFRVMPFELKHDVPCLGFYISHEETGIFCFLTDTDEVGYEFKGLNNVMVECNYDSELIDNNNTNYLLRDRVINNHLSINKCMQFLSMNDLSNVNNIVLLHASDFNSDTASFKSKVEQEYLKTVHIASKGLKIDFNSKPF